MCPSVLWRFPTGVSRVRMPCKIKSIERSNRTEGATHKPKRFNREGPPTCISPHPPDSVLPKSLSDLAVKSNLAFVPRQFRPLSHRRRHATPLPHRQHHTHCRPRNINRSRMSVCFCRLGVKARTEIFKIPNLESNAISGRRTLRRRFRHQ